MTTPRPLVARRSASRRAVLAAATIVLPVALASCAKGPGGPGGRGFQMPPMPVEVAEVHSQTVRDEFRALGTVESDEIIEVVSELSAVVRSLPFTEGQAVAEGALLAQLDDREIKAEADRAAAQRDLAQSNYERARRLLETAAISQQDYDNAGAQLKVAEANAALSRARLDKARIRAPFPGLVGRRRVSAGAYLQAGDVITDLARVNEMKVSFAAPERYAGSIRPGTDVAVTVPAYPGESFTGRVSVVDPIVNAETRTVGLVARIPNPQRKLRPGMSANVAVTLSERARALTVPDEAVFAQGDQSFVFLVNPDSTVARTAVMLGTRDSSRVEITQGLADGAMVVRAGHQKLFDGAKVMPVMSGAGGPGGPAAAAGGSAPGGAKPAAGAAAGGEAGGPKPAGGSR